MTVTGLFFFPSPPNTASPSAPLVSHLSNTYPTQPHASYFLDHRLFVDTSSLLPTADTKARRYTQMLTSSHRPQTTYVATKQSADSKPAFVSMPAFALDTFTTLLVTKLQPQWAHRQSVIIDHGASVSLSLSNAGNWTIRVGDLRVLDRKAASGAAALRGMLVELAHEGDDLDDEVDFQDADTLRKYEDLFKALLRQLFHGVPDFAVDGARLVVRKVPNMPKDDSEDSESKTEDSPIWELPLLYMDVLRGSRT